MCIFGNSHIHIKIDTNWYDVTNFVKIHPGGEKIVRKYNKKDATQFFYSIKKHHNYLHALDEFLIKDAILINKLNNKLN
jgi:cytochrome b involved in lipid metabolism